MKPKKTALIIAGLIAFGVVIAIILFITRPKAERKKPPRMTPVVLAQNITSSNRHVAVETMGKIIPSTAADLKARVSGEIIYTAPEWIEGGILKKGEVALRLEDDDYRIALDQAESELALEMGRQDVAKSEWAMLEMKNSSVADKTLALRQPQLKSAKARVEQAQLNLDRTEIKVPFDAIVTARYMNLGDQAAPQTPLGSIASIENYHVLVSVPVEKLKWIELPGNGSPGSGATVYLPDGSTRKGRVIKLLADLEEKGRMARCLVEIKNPRAGDSPVLLNSFVKVIIQGKLMQDVYSIPRSSFREAGKIWLYTKHGKLRSMDIAPLWGDRNHVFFHADIPESDMLITSPLSMAVEGMELRLPGDAKQKPAEKKNRQ